MNHTKRVELSEGQWALVRTRINLGDIEAQIVAAHERGYEDPRLDALVLLPRIVVEWSRDEPITRETLNEALHPDDVNAILSAVAQDQRNFPSGGSSGGGEASRPTRRSSGSRP